MKQKLLQSLRLRLALLVALLCSLGTGTAWADTQILSFSRSGSTDSYTTGYTFSVAAESKTGYYQDGGSVGAVRSLTLYHSSTKLFASTPGTITFTAKVGGGSSTTELDDDVYVCFVDNKGTDIDGTATSVTDYITTNTGDTYNISMPTAKATDAYGVKIYHTKQSGYNVRYFSFSLSYYTPSYTITAASNNNEWGTVSGTSTITATPASGYRVSKSTPYTVSPAASATVAQSGNVFTVTPSANTTVTINFEAIPTHTATFSVNGNTSRTATVAEGAAITFPEAVADPSASQIPETINGKTFVGWYTSEYSNASVAPIYVNTASTNMSTSDVTYYAVYATVEEEESDDVKDAVKSQTLSYDTWSYSGSTTDKTTYRLFHTDSYIESASFDLSKLIKVVVKGGTFGGSEYNSLTIGDGTNTWKAVTVSGKSETGTNTYTDGTALSGTKALRIICNSGTASSTGVRISEVEIYVKGTSRTESNYTTDARAEAGISYDNASVEVKLTSGSTGQALTNPNSLTVTYSSSDATVATVNSSTGAITELLKAGSTTITATFAGNATYKAAVASYTLNVTEKTPAGLAYAVTAVEKLTTDATFTNTLTNGYSLSVSYSSSATGVATVNASTGEVSIKGDGETTITATFAGDEDYEAGYASYTLTVSKATPTLSFASDNATLRQDEVFSGNELTNPASLPVNYSSSNTSVANVNASTGVPSFVAAGSTTITASFAGNDTYSSGSTSYTLKVLATPTISVSDDEVAYGETYEVDDSGITGGAITVTSDNENIATVDGLEITPVACGEVEITVSTAENETYKASSETFKLTVTAPAGSTKAPSSEQVVFYESFNTNEGTGGNDGGWSGSIASDDFKADNSWTTTNAKGANACTKFGTSSNGGSATTPEIELEEDIVYTLTFKAGAWDGKSEATTLSVAATNATIKNEANTAVVSSVTTVKGEWTSYTLKVIVTDESDPVTITFSTSGGNKRFFLDEVKVFYEEDPTATVGLNTSGYGTFCSVNPMDFSAPEGYTAWRISSIDMDGTTGTVNCVKITEAIKGGQGVLLYNKNAGGVKTNVTVTFADGTTEFDDDENLLVGTTAPTYVAADEYYGLKANEFLPVNPGTIPAGKALLPASVVPSLAKAFTFVFEDETTGITETREVSREEVESIFNLGGQRLQNLQRGINIVNGRKVLVK